MTLLLVAAGIMLFELLAKLFFRMKTSMLIRKLTRSLISTIFGNQLTGTPPSWKRKHWPNAIVLLFLAGTFQTSDSFAQYTVTDSLRWDRQWQGGALGLGEEDVLAAICNRCPLSLAMKQILPKGFTPYIADDVDKNIKVNFVAGRRWGTLLNDLATANDLDIELHKNGLRAIIDNSPKNRGRVSVVALAPKQESFFETKKWELIPGDTLKVSLERWASREGWSIIYDLSDDIYIDVHASFKGSLLEAVEQVLEAYRLGGILARVEMKYSYANTAIRISLAEGDGK
jgi:hypothetical protein